MFRSAVLVAILFLFALVHPAHARSDADVQGLKGRVKQVIIERADFSDHAGVWAQEPNVGVSTELFDVEGWLVESDEYDPRMSLRSHTTATHQPDGSTVSESRSFSKDGSVSSTYVATYDSKRKQTGARVSNADGSVQWTDVISRNSLGEAIYERVAGDGSLLYRAVWFDGPDGSRIADITFYREGLPTSQDRQVYNQEGRFILAESLGHRLVLDYREDGQRDTETSYGPNGLLSSQRTYAYDADGHKTGATDVSYDSNGRPPSKVFYTYGRNDLMTSMTHAGPGNLTTGLQISYEFDEQGNWIRETTSHCRAGSDEFGTVWQDPNPCWVTMRTITYYDDPQDGGRLK